VKNEGKEVGPNLSEIGSKLSKDAMFASILDPSAAISHNYETYVASLADGLVVSGLLVSQTERDVTLKNQEGVTRTIPRDQIEEFAKQPISLMPANLQKLLTVQELVDVVEYLSTLKKP
jgi:putative heme-binding domain-containing protein